VAGDQTETCISKGKNGRVALNLSGIWLVV